MLTSSYSILAVNNLFPVAHTDQLLAYILFVRPRLLLHSSRLTVRFSRMRPPMVRRFTERPLRWATPSFRRAYRVASKWETLRPGRPFSGRERRSSEKQD